MNPVTDHHLQWAPRCLGLPLNKIVPLTDLILISSQGLGDCRRLSMILYSGLRLDLDLKSRTRRIPDLDP